MRWLLLSSAVFFETPPSEHAEVAANQHGWLCLPVKLMISPANSFAIQQGKKVRPIDDLSQSFLNAAFGSEGKIELHDTETITAAILMFMRRCDADLVGKTIDLKAAYRQLPLSTEALRMSFIAVKQPQTGR